MFTINIKGKANPKDPKRVKLEMTFFKTGYNRSSKILDISGSINEWDNKTQTFKSHNSTSTTRNQALFDLKDQYYKVAEVWNAENRVWSPIELSRCFDEVQSRKAEVKSLSVLQMIESLIIHFTEKERYKNGKIITSIGNTRGYKEVKNSLVQFTQEVYGKSFSSYFFADINAQFLLDYMLHIRKQGIQNGNKGGLRSKLSRLRAVCGHAKKRGLSGVNIEIFECVGDNLKPEDTTSKAVSYKVFDKLEALDRSLFNKNEQLHLDMFMFSYYTGGMANVDVCNLMWGCIKENQIIYERTKYAKQAKPILIDRSRQIIEKYRGQGTDDYVFPIYTNKHTTPLSRMYCLSNFTRRLNTTIARACRMLKIKDKVTWYSARGSFITRMVDQGYSPCVVAEMAGNSPDVIYKHYYKNTKGEDMLKDMNKLFGA